MDAIELSPEGLRQVAEITQGAIFDPDGLRLRMRPLPMLAKCTERGKVLRGGFGPFGVGEMWCDAHDSDKASPEWADLPDVPWRDGYEHWR